MFEMTEMSAEALECIRDSANFVGDELPKSNYWVFSVYTMLLPLILKEVGSKIVIPQSRLAGPIWNYLDAACSAIIGIQQLTDKTTHRSAVTKFKGVMNILNAVQLTTLTAVNYAVLGGPGFAIAFGVGFALSLEETDHAARRMSSFEFWLEDSLSQREKNQQLIAKLRSEKQELKQLRLDLLGKKASTKIVDWTIEQKTNRVTDLQNKNHHLERDIVARIAHRKFDSFNNPGMKSFSFVASNIPKKADDPLYQQLTNIDGCQTKGALNNYLKEDSEVMITKTQVIDFQRVCEKKENKIHQQNKEDLKKSVKNNFVWGLAFAGMLLICFPIPPVHAAGYVLIAAASLLYIHDNADKIKKGISALASLSFFGSSGKDKTSSSKDENSEDLGSYRRQER